ncbi:MAG: glutamine-hydrolyzing GMP synthase [Lachnospiraceae bacterium]|nr:glutamine-hydrolyzing GMP synthase [Lachnospiraceae bacterium]
MEQEKVIVIDFGGQYNQLVARRVRECHVYCEIYSYKTPIDEIKAMNPKGIILTGGPNSCYEKGAPSYSEELFKLGIPVLGLCYGAQLMQLILGGRVEKAPVREYGRVTVFVNPTSDLFAGVGEDKTEISYPKIRFEDQEFDVHSTTCWMSHNDYISDMAPGFSVVAHTADCPVAACEDVRNKLYAIQFHPEVLHTVEGSKMIYNFVRRICSCHGTWRMDSFVEDAIESVRAKVGDGKVLLALSGGVDSSVLAALLAKAIGPQLTCVFVDHGLLRKNEGDEVERVFGKEGSFNINFIRVNAKDRYYEKLAGVTEPEKKRKIIGEEFIRVFEEEAKKIGTVDFLAQGTIYPDVVESGLGGESAVIKSHHNVGGLPDYVDFKEIIEPLRNLFKDEVRKAGVKLGLPGYIVNRQPFPGPGLGIRIIGEVTEEKVRIVQDADFIYREEVDKAAADYKHKHGVEAPWVPNQYFAALTNVRSVGVMGDERTYDYAVVVRAVRTVDFMTAEAAEIPFEVLKTAMSRIINEVPGVNRVFYDLTSKPPGTIELE